MHSTVEPGERFRLFSLLIVTDSVSCRLLHLSAR